MLKLNKWTLALATMLTLGLASCSDDEPKDNPIVAELTGIEYNADNIWSGWDKTGNLTIDGITFAHQWTEWNTSQGFVAAKIADNAFYNPMYEHQFEVITGGGVDGEGTPYMVANWNSSESDLTPLTDRNCLITRADGSLFAPESVYITNAAYPYYSMRDGDSFARKFVKGDNFILLIHGVSATGEEKTVRYYLANCTGDDSSKWIVDTWEKVDLTSLGTVKAIYLTMTSSDFGQWGINTPCYFAIDKFTIQ